MSVTCCNCGDPHEEYANEELHLGRCCVNLPRLWGFNDETGTYTVPSELPAPLRNPDGGRINGALAALRERWAAEGIGPTLAPPDEEPVDPEPPVDVRPRCASCDCSEFRLERIEYQYQYVDSHDEEDTTIETLRFGGDWVYDFAGDVGSVRCTNCGAAYDGPIEQAW